MPSLIFHKVSFMALFKSVCRHFIQTTLLVGQKTEFIKNMINHLHNRKSGPVFAQLLADAAKDFETFTRSTIMNLPDLQNQVTQTAEATSTLFVLIPILVMMIPLLLVAFPVLALKPPFSWFVSLYHRLMKQ